MIKYRGEVAWSRNLAISGGGRGQVLKQVEWRATRNSPESLSASVLVVSQFLKFWDCDLPFLNSFIYTYLVAIEMEWQAFKRTAVDPTLVGVRLPPVSLSLYSLRRSPLSLRSVTFPGNFIKINGSGFACSLAPHSLPHSILPSSWVTDCVSYGYVTGHPIRHFGRSNFQLFRLQVCKYESDFTLHIGYIWYTDLSQHKLPHKWLNIVDTKCTSNC